MVFSICDITQTAIFDFPDNGTLDDYLKEKGLYPSTTYFFLRSQPKDTIDSEFEVDSEEEIDTVNSAYGLQNTLENTSNNDVSPANQYTVCLECSCTYLEGDICLGCQQNSDFEKHLEADREIQLDALLPDSQPSATFGEDPVSLSLSEMRQQRVAVFSRQEENFDIHSYVDFTYNSILEQSAITSETGQDCVSNPPSTSSLATHPTSTNLIATTPLYPTPLLPIPLLPIPKLPTPLVANHFVPNPNACTPLEMAPFQKLH